MNARLIDRLTAHRRLCGAVLGGFVALVSGLVICCLQLGQGIRNFAYDQFTYLRPADRVDNVAVILIDEDIMATQKSNLDRAVYADLLDRLHSAKAVVFDIVFTDAFGGPSDARLAASMQNYVKSGNKIILGAKDRLIRYGVESITPQADFRNFAAGVGMINISRDRDNIVRRHWYGREEAPSLAYTALSQLNNMPVPPRSEERWINYYGKSLASIRMSDALTNSIFTGQVSDKVVFIGMGAITGRSGDKMTEDRGRDEFGLPGTTPIGPTIAGAEVQATVYANVVGRNWFWRWPRAIEVMVAILLGALLGSQLFTATRFPRTRLCVAGAILVIGLAVILLTNVGLLLSLPFIAITQLPVLGVVTGFSLWQQYGTVSEPEVNPIEDERLEGLVEASAACRSDDRVADIVFIHGLAGDARKTWTYRTYPKDFWPRWLGDDLSNVGVWSIQYDVAMSNWTGHTMPLIHRASNILTRLEAAKIGSRPVIFIVHSFGGLVIKRALRMAQDYETNKPWKELWHNTRGIVFLSTPHSGADLASWAKALPRVLRASVTVEELNAQSPELLELNTWFQNRLPDWIKLDVYFETRKVRGFMVVDAASANPGIAKVFPRALDSSHITICKPRTRGATVYLNVKGFVDTCLSETAKQRDASPSDSGRQTPAGTGVTH
jgi:CHASE2 domain-containing sensor protein/pimeloyl-ACP methyl ester carboxylesterase